MDAVGTDWGRRRGRPWGVPLVLTLIAAVAVGVVGFAAYYHQKNTVRAQTFDYLRSQSSFKRHILRQWYMDCQSALAGLSADPRVEAFTTDPSAWSPPTPVRRKNVMNALEEARVRLDLMTAFLTDPSGNVVPGTILGEPLPDPQKRCVIEPPAEYAPFSAVFQRDAKHKSVVQLALPICRSEGAPPSFYAVFLCNPWKALYAGMLIPDSSMSTAEVLILQPGEADPYIANPTKCAANPPLSVRVPVSGETMAAQALSRLAVEGEGLDYRGVPVLYVTNYVAGSGWGMVVKADRREVFAGTRITAFLVWGLILTSFLAVGTLSYVWWSRRHKALQDEFSALGLRYRQLVESAQEGIWVWDWGGRTLYANPRLMEMLGCGGEELRRSRVEEFVVPDHCAVSLIPVPGHSEVRETSSEIALRRPDGAVLWAILSVSSLREPEGGSHRVLGLLTDVTARHEAEAERSSLLQALDRKREELQRLLGELLLAQEKERRHLSHELHDEIVQLLTGADSCLQGVDNQLSASSPGSARALLERARAHLGNAGKRCRHLINILRPPDLETLGLTEALAKLLRDTGIPRTRFSCSEEDLLNRLPWEDQVVIFRVCQEALQNTRKHANANEAQLFVSADGEALLVRIQDDGQGFDRGLAANPGHFGLIGMRERVEFAGGTFSVQSSPGEGTIIEVSLPLPRRASPMKLLG